MSKSRSLRERLSNQLRSRGVQNSPAVADRLLEKRGQLKDGKLTAEGQKREAMGNEGRAKDRASKYSGRPASDFSYNSKTNRTKLKRD